MVRPRGARVAALAADADARGGRRLPARRRRRVRDGRHGQRLLAGAPGRRQQPLRRQRRRAPIRDVSRASWCSGSVLTSLNVRPQPQPPLAAPVPHGRGPAAAQRRAGRRDERGGACGDDPGQHPSRGHCARVHDRGELVPSRVAVQPRRVRGQRADVADAGRARLPQLAAGGLPADRPGDQRGGPCPSGPLATKL
ncbi:MAG: hypothetical protein CL844_03530 [Crocinitomicaceae bacterium]|nr:hypothetical protein [Crocinitomicaceae bacterium]